MFDGIGCNFSDGISRGGVGGSLNGVFVNGERIREGGLVELQAGDEVSIVCGNEADCVAGDQIGFLVERVVLVEEVIDKTVAVVGGTSVSSRSGGIRSKCDWRIAKADVLLSMCRGILGSDNPVSYIRKHVVVNGEVSIKGYNRNGANKTFRMLPNSHHELTVNGLHDKGVYDHRCRGDGMPGAILGTSQNLESSSHRKTSTAFSRNSQLKCCNVIGKDFEQINDSRDGIQIVDNAGLPHENGRISSDRDASRSMGCMGEEQNTGYRDMRDRNTTESVPPPGRKFYLNRLEIMGQYISYDQNVVSLPELFYPLESLQRVFIATFTSDVRWFLSYCEIPVDLPVTIACHNGERCWSSSPDKRISIPYSDFPNVVLVFPPFPEVIAFGNDRKKLGIACHHPKLFMLQRENSLRVVVTSANLVAKQWQHVTNTVWWQDFPRSGTPDYLSLFTHLSDGEVNQDSKSDFAAQLARFVASLVSDVPGQAHWILELTKYDFKGAVAYLVASIPGVYSRTSPYISDSRYFLGYKQLPRSFGAKLLGSVESSVVGLSHLFRTSSDQDGARLKKLALFLGKCCGNIHGMFEVILRRDTNIPADRNAVSVLAPDPEEFSTQDCVQLGFLPRNVAKWVGPLSDVGLFAFSAYINPKEVLAAALEGSSSKVKLIIYVTQGPSFTNISEVMYPEHVSALSMLIASIQRCVGLWRLQEVLSLYRWPEQSETDFLFGSSSIGAINPQFLAAFSAAAGKRSLKFTESEESDPDWGCWTASQESRNPSIRIIFPTIERVKNASSGILASKHMLCFSQKTWERLKTVNILHDAIPYPSDRVGLPMHVKVARRRFQPSGAASSLGWVYCGSHNFSAAAWGRPLSSSADKKASGTMRNNSVLGSRLHVCNYELGIVFIIHPSDGESYSNQKEMSLDDIVLPFVVPPPKYTTNDRPATAQAMRQALAALSAREREICEAVTEAGGWMDEEILVEEDELLDSDVYVTAEREDEKAYAETLWNQVGATHSC